MSFSFLWIALVIAFVDWAAVARKWRKLEYLAKPAVIISLLAWIGTNDGFQGQMIWFGLGLVFSLFGDIFLMLPKDLFVAGLVSFLFAHISYIIGYNQTLPPVNIPSLILAVIVGITAAQIYNRIAIGLAKSEQDKLKIPVILYTFVISLLLVSALLTLVRPSWEALPAILSSIGALLFFVSDTLLAWNKFVDAIPKGRILVMITYHLGQMGIIIGAGLHYIP